MKESRRSENDDLRNDYHQALDELSRAADALSKSVHQPDFHQRLQALQQANDRCKAARAAWEEHVKRHGSG